MIEFSHINVDGFEAAIRGMRNPMNSWDKSDSVFSTSENIHYCYIGDNDKKLMANLVKSGSDHRKFMRMINVTMDIKAPLYWWKEFDTYKVGTVANSCSTMHKIHDKDYWWNMIQLLPSSYNQLRTVQLNYEVLYNIYFARRDHKLDEWIYFCLEITKLPLMPEFLNAKEK